MKQSDDMLAILKITKIEKSAELKLTPPDKELERITLFISEYSPFHSGPETIEELLNHGPSFIPVKFSDGIIRILNRDKILYVKEIDPVNKQTEQELKFHFVGGSTLTAAIFEPLPERYGRTLDFLNSGRTFLAVSQNSYRLYINKKNIIKVEEL